MTNPDKADLRPAAAPPVARLEPRELTHHGHTRLDPYFWLRDDERKDPEVLAYLQAENEYTRAALAPVKETEEALFVELRDRLVEDDSSVPVKRDGYWYYHRLEAGRDHPIYCRRAVTMEAPEAVILDVNELAGAHEYYAAASLRISYGEQLLAWAEDTLSRRIYTVRVKDLSTGAVLPDRLEGTSGALAWASDDRTLFYVRRDPATLRADQLWRHELGTDSAADVLVYQELDDTFWLSVRRTKSKRWVLLSAHSTLSTEVLAIDAFHPHGAPRPVLLREPKHEYAVWHHGETFYIRTNHQAVNFRLMATGEATLGDKSTWREVIAHRDDVLLLGVEVFDRFLVVAERSDALRQLRVLGWGGQDDHYVAFDEPLYTAAPTDNPDLLLLCEMETGHGGASGRFARLRLVATEYAFMLYVLGLAPTGGAA